MVRHSVSTILLFGQASVVSCVFVRSFNSIMASCTTNDGNEKTEKKTTKEKRREKNNPRLFFQ